MRAVWSAAQIQGQRDYQEDYFAVLESDLVFYRDQEYQLEEGTTPEHQTLLVLADGMGGMGNGDLAASQVVEHFIKFYLIAVQHEMTVEERFKSGLEGANEAIADLIADDPSKEGMGATLIAVLWDEIKHKAYWLSVGDSALNICVAGKPLQRLNQKHTWGEQRDSVHLQAQVEAMSDTELDAIKDVLCAAVDGGQSHFVDLQTAGYSLSTNEQLLIATDGLETLDDARIQQLIQPQLAEFAAADIDHKVELISTQVETLIGAVKDAKQPNQDNTTLMIMGLAKLDPSRTSGSP